MGQTFTIPVFDVIWNPDVIHVIEAAFSRFCAIQPHFYVK